MKNSTNIIQGRIIASFIAVIAILTGCNQDGPCQSPLKWEVESISSNDISAKVNNKKHNADLTVSGVGSIVFKCKNKKERAYHCLLNIDGEWLDYQKSDCYNKDYNEFSNEYMTVKVNSETNTVTFEFLKIPETPPVLDVHIQSLEVETTFHVHMIHR